MRFIKKLDIFILKGYLQLFAGTFFICLFIFLMQFVWKYVDDLIGKGLTWDILAKFIWYSSLTLLPMSLPLAVLLASLITFGNFGERFELLAMKASGIPLTRILQPVFLLAIMVCGCSFYFQNKVGPEATKQLATLLWSMRQKSPELDIPEGIFYSDIPGYNLFVQRKDTERGMLYGMMIYSNSGSYEDSEIVLADSAQLQGTADKMHLKLTLYNGERFRNMDNQAGGNMLRANIPYMRESFIKEVDIIAFDNNFNLLDANLFSSNAGTKNLKEIYHSIDTIKASIDSIGHSIYDASMNGFLAKRLPTGIRDSLKIVKEAAAQAPFDTLYAQLTEEQKTQAWREASRRAESTMAEYDFRAKCYTKENNTNLIRHMMEAQRKFTLSTACLLFFMIGAPLGAIIRKGGLGISVVVSVLLFLFYYIINVAGENNAKIGEWNIYFGVWLSSMILFPLGLFLTHKANSDSMVFNIEGYRNFFMVVLGLRQTRKLNRKEVIIHDPDYPRLTQEIEQLSADCNTYATRHHLRFMPSYWRIFFRYSKDEVVIDISNRLEKIVEELHNSRDNVVIDALNRLPILAPDAHTRPFRNSRYNMITGILLPIGIIFWIRIWRYRVRLYNDMQTIRQVSPLILKRIG